MVFPAVYAALGFLLRPSALRFVAVGTAALLAACGGGTAASTTGTVPSAASPSPTPSPAAFACAAPSCTTTSSPVVSSASAPQTVALPGFGGTSGTLTLPAGTQVQGGSAALQVALESAPGGVPALQAARRRPAAVGVTNAQLYVVLQPSQAIALPAFPSFAFDAATTLVLPGENEFLAYYDPAQAGYRTVGGPVVAGGGVVGFAGEPAPLVLAAGQACVFALYGIPVPAAGNPVPLPASVGFTQTGQKQILTVSEQGYSGAFSASSNDGAVVTVSPASPTTFVLTAGATAGGTSVAVSDADGHTSLVDVGLTITIGTVR